MTSVPSPVIDAEVEVVVEGHFRLGIAVHRAECLLTALLETVPHVPSGEMHDLVDTTLFGSTMPGARVPVLVTMAFGLTASAIALWYALGFEDPSVTVLLSQRVLQARFERIRSAVWYGEPLAVGDLAAISDDVETHLDWALAVIGTMRMLLRKFGQVHFRSAF